MFTDDLRCRVWDQVQARSVRAFAPFLTPAVLEQAARDCGRPLRRCPLNWAHLVWLGLSLALDGTRSFASVLTLTFKLLHDADAFVPPAVPPAPGRAPRRSKHDPRRTDPTRVSQEAFVQARARMPLAYWVALVVLLADRFAAAHDDQLRWKHFRLLALDGTLINLPRWQALRDHYGTARSGKGGTIPQARLVMLQFPLSRVPYRFDLGPKARAEKAMAGPLLESLLPDDLVLMDRGFWSYGLFAQIQGRRAYFATRKIAQAHLRVVRRLGPKDALVRLVPTDKRWKKLGWPAALELRRIDYQVRGFRPTALITNLTDPAITRREWIGLAGHEAAEVLDRALYHRRWEIESFHPDYPSSASLYRGGWAA